jgi:hypothetical protein
LQFLFQVFSVPSTNDRNFPGCSATSRKCFIIADKSNQKSGSATAHSRPGNLGQSIATHHPIGEIDPGERADRNDTLELDTTSKSYPRLTFFFA